MVGDRDRRHQTDPIGNGGERRQHGHVVGTAGDVELVQLAGVLAHAQALRQEKEVELGALGGLGEVRE